MKTNGGFQVTKIKQLGDRIFERILSNQHIDAFNGAQGRILYVLWHEDGIPIKQIAKQSGLAITSLTTMLERMECNGLICREQSAADKRQTLLYLTEQARDLEQDYEAVSAQMSEIYYEGFSKEEISNFEAYLDRVRENLERWKQR